MVVFNGTAYSYVKNLQGDIVAILDSTKNVVVSYVYDAWGRPISCSGTMANTLGKINPFRYRGYVYDEETETYYLRSRYYKAGLSRFVNADSVLMTNQGLLVANLFAYCLNSPATSIDNDGNIPEAIEAITVERGMSGFDSADAAAKAAADRMLGMCLYTRTEFCTLIYQERDTGYYGYADILYGEPHVCYPYNANFSVPTNCTIVGYIHTHPNSDSFSGSDEFLLREKGWTAYLATPQLTLLKMERNGYFLTKPEVIATVELQHFTLTKQALLNIEQQWNEHRSEKCLLYHYADCVNWSWPNVQYQYLIE